MPETILFHDGGRFLDGKDNAAAKVLFERLEADVLSAHENLSNTPGFQDRSVAEPVDPGNPMTHYYLQSMQIDHAAADVPVSVDCPVSAMGLSGRHVSLDTPKGRLVGLLFDERREKRPLASWHGRVLGPAAQRLDRIAILPAVEVM